MENLLENYEMNCGLSVKIVDQLYHDLVLFQDEASKIQTMKSFIMEMNKVGKYLSEQTKAIEK